ncbi:MAG: hypothetical protein M1840_007412 [Geoglossum simile]|nr:MAG: hypothetical protein M1840_007412 [Geoglossum simile]
MSQPSKTTALILIADGTEEIEYVTCYDVLVRAGVDVKSVGVDLQNGQYATCSRNTRITPDIVVHETLPTPNILILPGGLPGSKTFCSSPAVLNLIRQCHSEGAYIAFICAATIALVAAFEAPLEGVRVTSHPSVRKEVEGKRWAYGEERVIVSNKVVTSKGPGTAMLFALTMVELLLGETKRNEISAPMMLAETL